MRASTLPTRSRPGERGTALVEFALVAPLMLMLMFGFLELGRMLFDYQAINGGLRNAARYLSRVPITCTAPGASNGIVSRTSEPPLITLEATPQLCHPDLAAALRRQIGAEVALRIEVVGIYESRENEAEEHLRRPWIVSDVVRKRKLAGGHQVRDRCFGHFESLPDGRDVLLHGQPRLQVRRPMQATVVSLNEEGRQPDMPRGKERACSFVIRSMATCSEVRLARAQVSLERGAELADVVPEAGVAPQLVRAKVPGEPRSE